MPSPAFRRALIAGLLLSFTVMRPAGASLVTITFDTGDPIGGLSVGSVLANQYAAFGVTFSPNAFTGAGGPTGSWATNTNMTVVSSTGRTWMGMPSAGSKGSAP